MRKHRAGIGKNIRLPASFERRSGDRSPHRHRAGVIAPDYPRSRPKVLVSTNRGPLATLTDSPPPDPTVLASSWCPTREVPAAPKVCGLKVTLILIHAPALLSSRRLSGLNLTQFVSSIDKNTSIIRAYIYPTLVQVVYSTIYYRIYVIFNNIGVLCLNDSILVLSYVSAYSQ